MNSKESLWEIAVRENSAALNASSGEKVLILAGSKGVGKSTMIQRFLDKSEPIKETLAIEYTFGRKSGRSLIKDVCHVLELGGGTLFTHLLSAQLDRNIKDKTLILVLDLSLPELLWNTLETLLQYVYNYIQKNEGTIVTETSPKSINEDHKDYKLITPFPMPLVIIGGKYDVFKDLDPEKRKLICKTLRQVAHSLSASLIFYSDKDATLVKKLKDVFNYHGFGGSQWKGFCTDYNKPLSIFSGADSFEQIGAGTPPLPSQIRGLSLDRFKHTYTVHFPQKSSTENVSMPNDPAKDINFKEPVVDLLRMQKDEELDRLRRENESRKRISMRTE